MSDDRKSNTGGEVNSGQNAGIPRGDASLGVAVIGAGYWGPNLVRNFRGSANWDLVGVCDLDPQRARKVIGNRSTVEVFTDLDQVLNRDDIDAIAVATPARTHAPIAIAALSAGKHVVVEKPLADTPESAAAMVRAAEAADRVLMIDHTYCYTPAVEYIRKAVADGVLGEILYIDSVRINLGLIQPDVDVFWDLAPHDLSILDFVLPGGLQPTSVSATGSDPLGAGKTCVGYLSMPLPGRAMAHVNVNWLSPTKIRQMVIGGSRRTLVWDDLNPQQRVAIFDRGVDLAMQAKDAKQREASTVSYRLGDITVPALKEREALSSMVDEFAGAIRERRAPLTDGAAGLRVLSVLDAVSESLLIGGAPAVPTSAVDIDVAGSEPAASSSVVR
jgi:predicted dehydrogenase